MKQNHLTKPLYFVVAIGSMVTITFITGMALTASMGASRIGSVGSSISNLNKTARQVHRVARKAKPSKKLFAKKKKTKKKARKKYYKKLKKIRKVQGVKGFALIALSSKPAKVLYTTLKSRIPKKGSIPADVLRQSLRAQQGREMRKQKFHVSGGLLSGGGSVAVPLGSVKKRDLVVFAEIHSVKKPARTSSGSMTMDDVIRYCGIVFGAGVLLSIGLFFYVYRDS